LVAAALACAFPLAADASPVWRLQHPSPTGNNLNGVVFPDSSHGWAVGGGGVILASRDGGDHWEVQESTTQETLMGVDFAGAAHGWAVGNGGIIVATGDGGATWAEQETGIDWMFWSVDAVDAGHVWAVGQAGTIVATTDGGESWAAQKSGVTGWLLGAAFADASRGWVVGSGGTILTTADGGATWTPQDSGTSEVLIDVAFTDATHGCVVGGDKEGTHGIILTTDDGGRTWTERTPDKTALLQSVAFSDARHGLACGADGAIVTTADGGSTWTRQEPFSDDLAAAAWSGPSDACVVGSGGTILVTSDGGRHWVQKNRRSTGASLKCVTFADPQHGWTGGMGYPAPVLKTGDGGTDWRALDPCPASGLVFVDSLRGCLVIGQTIFRSTDGGERWTLVCDMDEAGGFNGVAFADQSRGVAVGDHGWIVTTADGGRTWIRRGRVGDAVNLQAVAFPDAGHAWAVGAGGAIVASGDGGRTWHEQVSGTTVELRGVSFADAQHGWVVGGDEEGLSTILTTTDGGAVWTECAQVGGENLTGVVFADALHGWAVGYRGSIMSTSDGGANWSRDLLPFHLRAVTCIDATHAWAVGDGGAILAYGAPAPRVQIGGADDVWHTSPVTLSCTATVDASTALESMEYRTDAGLGWTAWRDVPGRGATRPLTVAGPGEVTVEVRATDGDGGVGSSITAVRVWRGVPTISAGGARAGWRRTPVTLFFVPVAGPIGVGVVEVKIGGRPWRAVTPGMGGYTATISRNGVTDVRYRMTDAAGTKSSVRTCRVRIDRIRPAASFGHSIMTLWRGEPGVIKFIVRKEPAGCARARVRIQIRKDGIVCRTLASTWLPVDAPAGVRYTSSLAPGRYTLVIRAWDRAGNRQAGASRGVLIVR
jgi:photosystem II stability/assembly factor-like uncharacterized protein